MLTVSNLTCEYMKNPTGIGDRKPRFSWMLESEDTNVTQASYHLQVCKETPDFIDLVWDSGKVDSDKSVGVDYSGSELMSRTQYFYRVKITDNKGRESGWSEIASFETGILSVDEWQASFITADSSEKEFSSECPLFRKDFCVKEKTIKTARIYSTALGVYELYLNGRRVGEDLFSPGWTNYHKRLQVQTYDVTSMLSKGSNTLGAILGNGWYKGCLAGWVQKDKEHYGKTVALLLQMHIKYDDGTEQLVISDESWKTSPGPITMSEFYHGEHYDARLEIPGWNIPGYDCSAWRNAELLNYTKSILIPQEGLPIRKIETIKPVSLFTTPKGETVLDMGQNMVGFIRFNVKGPEGSKVILQHFEVLDKEGNVYTENLRSAQQTVVYTLKGQGTEVFEPHFSFHGFQYVHIAEYPGTPSIDDFTGIVVHSAMPATGSFTCSNDMVNQLYRNIVWGQKGNFVDVPTDCPQRDERLGWTGDAQVFFNIACFNMDTSSFYKKWLRDLKSEQLDNGAIPHIVPHVLSENDYSACGWADVVTIGPWTYYQYFSDAPMLEEMYPAMEAWVEYIRSHSENGLIWNTGSHFGDWLGLDAKEGSYTGATPKDLLATAFYAYSTQLVAKAAKVLGYTEKAAVYESLHSEIVEAFRNEFITPAGRLAAPTQTAHVLTLMFDLAKEKDKNRIVESLVKLIMDNNWHLTTGFLGTPYLCHVLSRNNRTDVAYRLLLQTDYPSWLYPITKGATTIWEHWDGIKPDGSFWSRNMNSFNHYAYGAVGDWMVQVMAGLNRDEEVPGYKHIIFSPVPGGGITHAAASYLSLYGLIKISWKLEDNNFSVQATIPHNTTASLKLPSIGDISELRFTSPAITAESLSYEKSDLGLIIELGSGSYSMEYALQL